MADNDMEKAKKEFDRLVREFYELCDEIRYGSLYYLKEINEFMPKDCEYKGKAEECIKKFENFNGGWKKEDSLQEQINEVKEAIERLKGIDEEAEGLIEEEYKVLIKSAKEVRDYVKKSVGNFNQFNEILEEFSNVEYKEKGAYLPDESLKSVFGHRSGLMAICTLEDGTSGKKKMFSAYRRYCKKIAGYYKNLGPSPKKGAGDDEKKDYIKKYNDFVDKSSALAVKYLKIKGPVKLKKLKKLKVEDLNKNNKLPRDYAMDACKIAFMCLVAACSKKKERSDFAIKKFSENQEALQKVLK